MSYANLLGVCLIATVWQPVSAQDKPPQTDKATKPATRVASDAEKKFETALLKASSLLNRLDMYTAAIECDWKQTGHGDDKAGKTKALIKMMGKKHIYLEISNPETGKTGYLAVANGKNLTRAFVMAKLFSKSMTDDPMHDLLMDGLTIPALRSMGADFLISHRLSGTLLAQTVLVEDLGEGEVDGKKVDSFRVTLTSGRRFEVSYLQGDQALPVEWKTLDSQSVDEKSVLSHHMHTRLKWDFTTKLEADQFVAKVPDDAKQVDDLSATTVDANILHQLGKPCPALVFQSLDAKSLATAEQKDKAVVALIFWASWTTPSPDDAPALKKFVEDYTAKGVVIWAVNVGERPEVVKAITAKLAFPGIVALDPQGEVASSLGVRSVPGVVLIGKDGTIQSFHRGGQNDVREGVRRDLDLLLSGKPVR
jgi:thiol-disulfide isomerase/thioredoxin